MSAELLTHLDIARQEEGRRPPISLNDRTILLEITNQCYTGCTHCYKGDLVSSRGAPVPLEDIARRISWITRFTDATEVVLLGGEPLLHPQFPKIVDTLLAAGYDVTIITAGMIAKGHPWELESYNHMLDLYEKGLLDVELSYQPGRNERAYRRVHADLKARIESRRKSLIELISSLENDPTKEDLVSRLKRQLERYAFYSAITISEAYAGNFNKFESIFRFLFSCEGYVYESITITEEDKPGKPGATLPISEVVKRKFEELQLHFAPYEKAAQFIYRFNGAQKAILYKLMGADRIYIDPQTGEHRVDVPPGTVDDDSVCPAMFVQFDDRAKTMESAILLIRSDGEVCFPTPHCIATVVGIGNVDQDRDAFEIYAHFKAAILQIQDFIRETMRSGAASKLEFCKTDPQYPRSNKAKKRVCPSCPYDVSCNACHAVTAQSRELIYQG